MDSFTRTQILFIVGFFIITISIKSVWSIRCYQCNSHYDDDCGGEGKILADANLKTCDSNSTFCRKIDQEIHLTENSMGPDTRVIRDCGHDQGNEKPYYFTSGLGGQQYVYGCNNTDGCNGATIVQLTPLLIFTAILARIIL
ncbi:hypothetical protein CHUAL_009186 [Chamberlinius hualienensis]